MFSCCSLAPEPDTEHEEEEEEEEQLLGEGGEGDTPKRPKTPKTPKSFKTPKSNAKSGGASSFTFGSGMRWSSSKAESNAEPNLPASGVSDEESSTHGGSVLGYQRASLLGQPPPEPRIQEEAEESDH